MSALADLFPSVLLASRDAALLALAAGALLLLVFRGLAPKWRHLLWMLVVARLMLPALPESTLSWRHWAVSEKPTPPSLGVSVAPDGADRFGTLDPPGFLVERTVVSGPPSEIESATRRWTLREILPAVWAAGTLLALFAVGAGWASFQRRVRRRELRPHPRRDELETLLANLCAEQGIARPPRLVLTDAVAGPALTGWWRPRILMPGSAAEDLTEAQLRLVLLHELGHLRRHDVLVNWVLCLLQALHWFNPVVWWAFRRIRVEAERATDEWVLRRIETAARADYGETLIRLLESAGPRRNPAPGLVGVVESRTSLRSRLLAIGCYRGTARPWLALAAALAVSGIAAVGLTQAPAKKVAEPPQAAKEEREREPLPALGGDSQIELSVKVWRIRDGQPDELIATPTAVTTPGQWMRFEETSELHLPTSYGIPTLPEELAANAVGGGTIGGSEDEKKWTTDTIAVVLPPHPTGFETRRVGWTLRLRPELADDGSILVDGLIEQDALKGFANHGKPITAEQPSGVFRRTKTLTLAENRQLLPVFLERRRELRFEPNEGRLVATVEADAGPQGDDDAEIVEGFADSLREPGLPGIRIEVKARPVDTRAASEPEAQGETPPSVYVTARFIEIGTSEDDDEPPLSEPQLLNDFAFQRMIRSLNRKMGVNLLSAPSVVLALGESGHVEATQEFIYPEDYTPATADEDWTEFSATETRGFPATPATPINYAKVPLGVRLDVLAKVLPDGMIELDLSPRVSEVREMLNFGGRIPWVKDGKLTNILVSENAVEMPVFDATSQRTVVRVPDGHTVVLGGFVRDRELLIEDRLPDLGWLADSRKAVERRYLYVFVTAALLDTEGLPANRNR